MFATERSLSAIRILVQTLTAVVLLLVCPRAPAFAGGGVTFHDLAADPASGLTYHRVASPDLEAIFDAVKALPVVHPSDILFTPIKPHGAPGVALLDFDGDGDLDIFVPNGPGAAHGLFSNQLRETGRLSFVDVAAEAGVDAPDQDGTGVCAGDIDNDGDTDLLVLGRVGDNRLFENEGDGTFSDITALSGVGGGSWTPSSCAMGDVDGDGLLDLFVGNTFDWSSKVPILVEPFAFNQPNQLFHNEGGNVFTDVSAASGVRATVDITWAVAMLDVDQDGDTDLVTANDQGGIPIARDGGVDRGFVRVLLNDGSGHLEDVSAQAGTLERPGAFMGLSFADLNCDGRLDFIASNVGDWFHRALGIPYELGDMPTGWFLGAPGGRFEFPGMGPDLVATGFGWGTAAVDYDNDGDVDLVSVGGLDGGPFVDASNPEILLANDGCTAHFSADTTALAGSTDHSRRNEMGLADGDLDGDGFVDLVSVSNFDVPEPLPLVSYPFGYDSPYDPAALFVPTFVPLPDGSGLVFSGIRPPDGTLSVEVNDGGNGNGSVEVHLLGTVDLLAGGRSNRDGIGATVRFTPGNGPSVLQPVTGGGSYASQGSLTRHFGLGRAATGTVEVLWPGGTRNRLYDVRAGERLTFPEIPCSFDADWGGPAPYRACVRGALDTLVASGILTPAERGRFLASALEAFAAARTGHGH